MQTKIHEPTQIVEVMLTHAEQADEAVKKQLKELYAQYKGTNRRRAAERAVQARKAAGQ